MKILQTNNYQPANFKATYPVVHWVAETNGSFAPVSDLKSVKKLQGKIIRILNKPLDKSSKAIKFEEQNLRSYIGRCDIDYRNNPNVRTFYNRERANLNGNSYSAYIISGDSIAPFEEDLAKIIGNEKRKAIQTIKNAYSPEAIAAIKSYNSNGLQYVNRPELRIKDTNTGMTYALHTKFQIIRNSLGKIKDFKFIDARFLPEFGPESPFERLKNNL